MKYGIHYNIFSDSIELLEGSIKSVRDSIDHVAVVWQDVSNFGEASSVPLKDIIEDLKSKKLIDSDIQYRPNLKLQPNQNEINKRNIGWVLNEDAKCDYTLAADSDEYYIKEELDKVKFIYEKENLDGGYCFMNTFYKSTEFQLEPLETYGISLFYKTGADKMYKLGYPTPVEVDPTRRAAALNYKIFDREIITMNHLSYIRKDIRSKFNNSSARVNFDKDIENLIDWYENWDEEKQALVAGRPPKFYDIKKVDDKFNIKF